MSSIITRTLPVHGVSPDSARELLHGLTIGTHSVLVLIADNTVSLSPVYCETLTHTVFTQATRGGVVVVGLDDPDARHALHTAARNRGRLTDLEIIDAPDHRPLAPVIPLRRSHP